MRLAIFPDGWKIGKAPPPPNRLKEHDVLNYMSAAAGATCIQYCELEYYPYDKYKSPHTELPPATWGGGVFQSKLWSSQI